MAAQFDYSGWTNSELERANSLAQEFLTSNTPLIHEALSAQVRILAGLVDHLNSGKLRFEDRLDCLAHIADVSQMVRESAEGFFELGSLPMIAKTLASADI